MVEPTVNMSYKYRCKGSGMMAVNPWKDTIFLDACRVCSKSFCCKTHRNAHEEKTHGKVVACVKSLPEICQKCNVFVSNIDDIKSDCIKISNKSQGVLIEYSPNVVIDRPRKRTFSTMSTLKKPPSDSTQDCIDITGRIKKQARKRSLQSGTISNVESAVVKKESNEISPKFEEVKSSSTPILPDRQDLRVRLLKSKIEAPIMQSLAVNSSIKSPSLISSKRNFLDIRKAGISPDVLSSNEISQHTPNYDAEESVYGTPDYGLLTPFSKGTRSHVRFSDGDPNVSVYGTPKSSLDSFDRIAKMYDVTRNASNRDVCVNSTSNNQDGQSEEDQLNKNLSNPDDHVDLPSNIRAEGSSIVNFQGEECSKMPLSVPMDTRDGQPEEDKLTKNLSNPDDDVNQSSSIPAGGSSIIDFQGEDCFVSDGKMLSSVPMDTHDQLEEENLNKNSSNLAGSVDDQSIQPSNQSWTSTGAIVKENSSQVNYQGEAAVGLDKKMLPCSALLDTQDVQSEEEKLNKSLSSLTGARDDRTNRPSNIRVDTDKALFKAGSQGEKIIVSDKGMPLCSVPMDTQGDQSDEEESNKHLSCSAEAGDISVNMSPNASAVAKEGSLAVNSQGEEHILNSKMQPRCVLNEEVSKEVKMDTTEVKLNDNIVRTPCSFRSSDIPVSQEMGQVEELIRKGELQNSRLQENQMIKTDHRGLSCSEIKSDSVVEKMPSAYRRSYEDNYAQLNFKRFKNTPKSVGTSCQGEAAERLGRALALNSESFSEGLNSLSVRDTSELSKVPVCKESPPNAICRELGETDVTVDEIIRHRLSTDSNLDLKPTSKSYEESSESPKFKKKKSSTFSTNETIIMSSGPKKFKLGSLTDSIIESHFQSFDENKENVEIIEHMSMYDSHYESIQAETDSFHTDQRESKHKYQANILFKSSGHTGCHLQGESTSVYDHGFSTPQPSSHQAAFNTIKSDSSNEWKSFTGISTDSKEPQIAPLEAVGNLRSLIGSASFSKMAHGSSVTNDVKESDNPTKLGDHLREDNEESSVASKNSRSVSVGCGRSSLCLSSNFPSNSLIRADAASVSMGLRVGNTQKYNIEDATASEIEDSLFKMVEYHSTPMVRTHNRTSTSLDEDSLDCTRSRQNVSSPSASSAKKGFFGLAKKRIKSYFPYFFSKSSKSTEDLPSSSLAARSLAITDATVKDVSRTQSSDVNGESENQPQGILRRRPIWSWPKRRRPIHANRTRVRDDTFDDTQEPE